MAQPDHHAAARGHRRPPGRSFALAELLGCLADTTPARRPGHARPAAARRPEERATLTVVPASAPTQAADRNGAGLRSPSRRGRGNAARTCSGRRHKSCHCPRIDLWCTCYVPGPAVGADDLHRSRQTPAPGNGRGTRQVHRQGGGVSRATVLAESTYSDRAVFPGVGVRRRPAGPAGWRAMSCCPVAASSVTWCDKQSLMEART